MNPEDRGIVHSFSKSLLSIYYVTGTVLSFAYDQRKWRRLNKFGSILWHLPRGIWKVKSLFSPCLRYISGRWKSNKTTLMTWVFWLLGFYIIECFLVLKVTFRSIRCRSKQRGQDKEENTWLPLSSELEFNWDSTCHSPCIPLCLAVTKFMVMAPPVIPVMGCNPGGALSV